MTKEFESGMRYQGYAQTQGFNPIKPVDVTPLLRENRRTEQENLQRMLDQSMSVMRIQQQQEQDAIQRQNELATLVSQQELSDLAEFSQTLTSAITTYQEYRKEKDIEAGMALAYTEGLPDEVVAKFKQDEAVAEEAAVTAKGIAASLEAENAPTDLVKRARNMSGWKSYGYARGIAMLAGDQYGVFYEQAADRVNVEINGRQVNFNNYQNSSEYAAVQAEIRRQYLKNFEGMNLGLLNEYLFPGMKRYEEQAATSAAIKLREQLQAERKTEMLDSFFGAVQDGRGGEYFIKLINQSSYDFGGRGEARKTLIKNLQDGLNSGSFTAEQVEDILNYKFDQFGNGKLVRVGDAFARDLQDMPELLMQRREKVITDSKRQKKLKMDSYVLQLQEEEKQQGPFTEAQLIVKMSEARDMFQGEIPEYLEDYVTRSDLDEKASRTIAEGYLADDGKITEGQLRLLHPSVAYDMRRQGVVVKDDFGPSRTDRAAAKTRLDQLAGDIFQMMGLNKGPAHAKFLDSAMRDYERRYAQAFLSNKYSEGDLHEGVLRELEEDIKKGGRSYYDDEKITTTSEQQRKNLQQANTYIGTTGVGAVTTKIPGLQEATDEFRLNLASGKRTVPTAFKILATQLQGYDSWDLATAQHKAYGYGDVARPRFQEQMDKMSPAMRYLLKDKPTPSRVLRAQLQATDTTPFLELVKSKESKAYGEYDAMNKEGRDGGHTAIGSANSKDVFGRGLSEMTVGEVMQLQDEGKLHAAGAYQIIRTTMRFVVGITPGITKDSKFDKATQDKLALALYRNRVRVHGTEKNRLMAGLRSEWIGLGREYGVTDEILSEAIDSMSVYNQPQNLLPGLTAR